MTALIQNTALTNTTQFLIDRVNELATTMSNVVITVNSNTTIGNANLNGIFTANSINAGSLAVGGIVINSSSIFLGQNISSFSMGNTISLNSLNSTSIWIGNSTVNAYMNSSTRSFQDSVTNSFVNTTVLSLGGTLVANSTGANNAFNFGGLAPGSYQLTSTLNSGIASYLPNFNGIVNASSFTTGSYGNTSTVGGSRANVTFFAIGNSSVNTTINSTCVTISNSTANIIITNPSAAQISSGSYFYNANGTWSLIVGTINTTSIALGNTTVNTIANSIMLAISNQNANIQLAVPTTTQISNGQYWYNANSTWAIVTIPGVNNNTSNTTGTTAQLIDSYNTAIYTSADYLISINDNNANNHYTTKILVGYDTTNAYMIDYGGITTNSAMGVFTANANSTFVKLYFTPVSTNTTIKWFRVSV